MLPLYVENHLLNHMRVHEMYIYICEGIALFITCRIREGEKEGRDEFTP